MNLTSKRLLQFMTVCAGICALSATATTQYVADSFEAAAGTNGMLIAYYKGIVNEFGNLTNQVWSSSGSGDASKLVTSDVARVAYTGIKPITNVTESLVLNLETEGQTLTRVLDGNATNDFVNGSQVYVDTLIKFTPSEDDPVITDGMVKAAVFVNVASNLVVFHGVDQSNPTNTATAVAINPAQWYRLTILLGKQPTYQFPAFEVLLNGTPVTSSAAYSDSSLVPVPGGVWFMSASADTFISAVAFQGTGQVDELVVSDEVDFGSTPTVILLTLTFDSGISSVLTNSAPVLNGQSVYSNATITITANNATWHHVASVDGTGVYTPTLSLPQVTSTGTVAGTNGATIAIHSQLNQMTVTYDTNILDLMTNSVPVASGATLAATTPVSVTAKDWYKVDSTTGSGSYTPGVALPQKVSSGTIYGANLATLDFVSAYTTDLPAGYGSDASRVAGWAGANGKTEQQVNDNYVSWLDDYLLNKAPDTNAELEIKEIVVDTGAGTADITVGTVAGNVNFGAINGTLKVSKRASLSSGGWGTPVDYGITVNSPNTTATVTVTLGTDQFLQAVVE